MYLLDTNVVSEFRKISSGRADPQVRAWAEKTASSALYLSVVTVLELETGLLRLDRSDKVQAGHLRRWLWDQIIPSFGDRILGIDLAVARQAARFHIPKRRPSNDALIAATAVVHGMILVTRNVADFDGDVVQVINPWVAAADR